MPRVSSNMTGTDITVEPRLITRPVSEMSDEELEEEVNKLRAMRGVTTTSQTKAARHLTPKTKTEKPFEDDDEVV